MSGHEGRAHSKFSASGAERWFNCPGSVELSEGQPDKSSPWAIEGTEAHEVLEATLRMAIENDITEVGFAEQMHLVSITTVPREMIHHARNAANFILDRFRKAPGSDIVVETRVYLDFIHPEMFGTFDGGVVEYFGTLDVFDYKYGQGHAVNPYGNLQMIFYAIGLAHTHHWNFKRVRLWIIQPRIKGYDGPVFWEITVVELRKYVKLFKSAVERVEENPNEYVEGSWCHWCKAKRVCPLKRESKLSDAISIFSKGAVSSGIKKESVKEKSSEAEWRKKAKAKKARRKKEGKARAKGGDFYAS